MRALYLAVALAAGLVVVHAGDERLRPVIDALQPSVRSLTRAVHTYHYATRSRMKLPDTGSIAPRDPRTAPFLAARIARFWDLTIAVRPHATASGLYSGVDPVSSRTFGGVGEGWTLVQIVLPRGLRFIDARRSPGDGGGVGRLSAAARTTLAERGCDAELAEPLLIGLESQACRAVAVEVLRALGVDAIVHSFPRLAFRECVDPRDAGFILLDLEAVAPPVTVFTSESAADDGAADRRIIRELFLRASRAGSERPAPWPGVQPAGAPVDMQQWMREHLFGCGEHPEDRLRGNAS